MKNNKDTVLKISSLIAFGFAVGGILILVFKKNILSVNTIGIIIQVCMVVLMIWARITFGIRSFQATANTTAGKLVTSGPYHYLRHPIYAAIIYFVWAGVLSQPDYLNIAAAFCVSTGLIIRMVIEEFFLLKTYDEYKAYSGKTVRLIPFLF